MSENHFRVINCQSQKCKYYWVLFVLLLISSPTFSQKVSTINKADLVVSVPNIKEISGKLFIGVFNKAEFFPKDGHQYKILFEPIEDIPTIHILKDLPFGEYALAIYHDINNDEECNKNFLGIPKEPYGFSNNIKPKLKAPSFDKTKFLHSGKDTIVIKLFH